MGKSRKILTGDARTIILRVVDYFEQEKFNRGVLLPVDQIIARTCQATGVSSSTIKRIKKEALKVIDEEAKKTNGPVPLPELKTPSGKRSRKKTHNLDSTQVDNLREIVTELHTCDEALVTSKIWKIAKSELGFKGGVSTFRRLLKSECGFRYKFCKNKLHTGKKCWLIDTQAVKKKELQVSSASTSSNAIIKGEPCDLEARKNGDKVEEHGNVNTVREHNYCITTLPEKAKYSPLELVEIKYEPQSSSDDESSDDTVDSD